MPPRFAFPRLTTEQLEHRIEAASLCADQVFEGADPDVWTPDIEPTGAEARAHYEARARAVCAGCEVIAECLEWALRKGDTHHIYGGTAPWERARMIRSLRRRAAFPTSRTVTPRVCEDDRAQTPERV
jgi:WhiB family redox-sensing transcriptional regulator